MRHLPGCHRSEWLENLHQTKQFEGIFGYFDALDALDAPEPDLEVCAPFLI